jgi:hypothetical protein
MGGGDVDGERLGIEERSRLQLARGQRGGASLLQSSGNDDASKKGPGRDSA